MTNLIPASSQSSLKGDSNVLKDSELSSSQNKDSKERNDAKQIPRYTVKDLFTAKPPNFKAKVQAFFYRKGLSDRPEYLEQIYKSIPRYIYVNFQLPEFLTDSEGRPLLDYPRNKIRTTKYTPISFLPKNILFQFTNIANAYFLLVVILGAFQIFGVASPGLAAVPLIVIICITAIKDAFEDYGRGSSDSELNNSPIHLLNGLHNNNVLADQVGPWRSFKKRCSAMIRASFRGIKRGAILTFGSKKKKGEFIREQANIEDNELRRISTIVSDYSYQSRIPSIASRPRKSNHSHRHHSEPMPNSILNPELQKSNESATVFKNRCWKDISVGDMIRIRVNEEVPADVVILSSSDIEGACYIETKNLDGETNLKTKTSLHCGGSSNLKHSRDLGNSKFWIECDSPNPNLYSFKGTIHYENYDERGNLINPDEKEAINNDNVLLRGSMLRNTKWAIGVVIYTGSESKVMLNSNITPTKKSKISKELNLSVIINFVLVFVLCFVSGLINGLFYNKKHTSRVYYDFQAYGSTPAANGVIDFFVTLIIYQSLIPISLYISIEIIKTVQAFFIYSDIKMYYDRLSFPCIPKSWNISDDLGQIEYIFSDKTGTLTQNVMEFKKCTIKGKSYGLAYTEAKQGLDKREGVDIVQESEKWKNILAEDRENMLQNLRNYSFNDQLREEFVTFVSNEYVEDIMTESKQKHANEEFMLALALCHTVVTEVNEQDSSLQEFKAESPDEAALVAVARDLGIVFSRRLRRHLLLHVYGEAREYELLEMIPFTSTRKRMTCIFKTPDGKISLVTKGADNIIFQRLDPNNNDNEMVHKTALHLETYAKEGLRTLCVAQKELDANYFDDWLKRYKEANSSIDDDRDIFIDDLNEEIEKDLILLGGTAIEDRLQQGVPDSIEILGNAGIKLWVLTGDRIETAINIGFSCNLLGNEMKLLVIRPDESNSVEHIDSLISDYLNNDFEINTDDVKLLIENAQKDHSTPSPKNALIIDGAALSLVFNGENKDLEKKFLILGKQCKSVVCCRVSPAQKAQVVSVVKNNLKVMTLAIGDGANDVAMIQAANVGVGIAGEEGRQAVMSSDYAIGQFRYLTRLLLVHGRWSYKRLSEMIPCFFYKNVVFTFTCFWYGIYNNFDGSYLYEYTFLMFYNLAFTSLPVIFMAVFDQDVSDTVSLLTPQLYRSGILGLDWSQYKFAWYMLDGLYQSVISFFFPYLLYYRSFQNPQGLPVDHRFWIGVVAVCISVCACNIYVVLRQNRWDWLSLLIDTISLLLVFWWAGIWSSRVYAQEFYKAGAQVFGTLSCWCCIFIAIVVCLLPRFVVDFYKINFMPRDIDIIRERVRMGEYDDYPQGYDPTDLDDVEKHRLLNQIIDNPDLMEKLEIIQPDSSSSEDSAGTGENSNALKKTFKSIKRKATINRSRRDTAKSRRNTLNEQFNKPIDLAELKKQMIESGELNYRTSLERISTTHELPGLTQAETLISYHTRNSVNLER